MYTFTFVHGCLWKSACVCVLFSCQKSHPKHSATGTHCKRLCNSCMAAKHTCVVAQEQQGLLSPILDSCVITLFFNYPFT